MLGLLPGRLAPAQSGEALPVKACAEARMMRLARTALPGVSNQTIADSPLPGGDSASKYVRCSNVDKPISNHRLRRPGTVILCCTARL
jgi:hypothetical protein